MPQARLAPPYHAQDAPWGSRVLCVKKLGRAIFNSLRNARGLRGVADNGLSQITCRPASNILSPHLHANDLGSRWTPPQPHRRAVSPFINASTEPYPRRPRVEAKAFDRSGSEENTPASNEKRSSIARRCGGHFRLTRPHRPQSSPIEYVSLRSPVCFILMISKDLTNCAYDYSHSKAGCISDLNFAKPAQRTGFHFAPTRHHPFPPIPRLKGDGLMRISVCDEWHRVFGHSVPNRDPDQVGDENRWNFQRSMRTDTGYRNGQFNPKSTG